MCIRPKTRQCFLWSQQLIGVSLFGLCLTVTFEPGITATPITKLNNWRFNPKTAQLEFTLSAGTTPHYFYLSQPPRLVIDLPDTKMGRVVTKQDYSGSIQRIRVSQLNASITRIVLDLADGTFLDPQQVKLQPVSRYNPTRWVVRPVISSTGRSVSAATRQPAINTLSPNPYSYYPPTPSSNLPASANYLQLPNTLPSITTNQQQPYITVPPLAPSAPSQIRDSILPPPNFPTQSNNLSNIPSVANPNFPVPTLSNLPNYPANEPQVQVIEFGQPLPKPRY
ncbi:AMIN domain-containing protein [Nostoc sp. FACHB-110]|uniref:AMIN domain-containing protein n=1 Tax=Nostoc sp. FACHB-110 TaxID=2692834 RepID=UPI001686006E|nr:AMIN domain-containing protein [Nostoc sp. FACHB-110]MBD2436696.1 AMIN domain-containing protein [Nostoc sp. FACHB-110]